jgi:chromosome segregation ATPase
MGGNSTVDDLAMIDQLSGIIGQLTRRCCKLNAENSDLKDVNLTQGAEISGLRTNTCQLAESVGSLSAENSDLKNVILARNARIDELEADTRQLAEFIKERNDKVSKLEDVIRAQDDKIKDLEDEIRDLADVEFMLRSYQNPAGRRIKTQEPTLRSETLQFKAVEEVD